MKTKTSRASRATAKLSSWMKAVRIAHQATPEGLKTVTKDGRYVLVVVSEGPLEAQDALGVDLEGFWSRDMALALETFHKLTQALGYGTPSPVPNRKMASPSELTHHDYWIRHTEVAISPNPDPEVFTRYKGIIDTRVRRFCFNAQNRRLLWEVGMDEDDVRSIVMTWIVSFECLHKVLVSTDHDNEKLLQAHLEQRLAELHARMTAMARDSGYQSMDEEVVARLLEKQSQEFVPEQLREAELFEELDDAASYRERKARANGLLRTALKKMPKNIATERLEDIATRPGVEDSVSAKAIEHLTRMTKSRKKVRSNNVLA